MEGPRCLACSNLLGPSASFIHSFTHSLLLSLLHSLTPSLTNSFTHSFTHSLCHSLTPSLPLSLPPSLPHSLTHLFLLTDVWYYSIDFQVYPLSDTVWRFRPSWREALLYFAENWPYYMLQCNSNNNGLCFHLVIAVLTTQCRSSTQWSREARPYWPSTPVVRATLTRLWTKC